MTVGKKTKTFRTIQGISQNVLGGELAGIDGTTIRKYELGSQKPKSDQLLKIVNALGVSINVFTDFDIETASDVLTLLFKMEEQIDMEIDGEKDSDGNLIPDTICIRFKHPEITCHTLESLSDFRNFLWYSKLPLLRKGVDCICHR